MIDVELSKTIMYHNQKHEWTRNESFFDIKMIDAILCAYFWSYDQGAIFAHYIHKSEKQDVYMHF